MVRADDVNIMAGSVQTVTKSAQDSLMVS